MNLLVRLLLVVLRALRYPAGGFAPLAEARLPYRVLPNDLDFNLHMNNARYLSLMDLGRVDLLNRLGLLRYAFRGHWVPVLGAVRIRYVRPLRFWQRYDLVTRIAGWDAKWFYLEQRFEAEGRLIAVAQVKGLLRGPGGSIPTDEVLARVGVGLPAPPLTAEFQQLPD